MEDIIVSLVIGVVIGAVVGGSLIIYWWRADRNEVDAYTAKVEKELAEYKGKYFKVKHVVGDNYEMEFATHDCGINWCVVRSTSRTVEFVRPLDPLDDAELITELCDKIGAITSREAVPEMVQEASILE